jgi:hypothetical protein
VVDISRQNRAGEVSACVKMAHRKFEQTKDEVYCIAVVCPYIMHTA